ncbi:MAG TPA: DNA polymerase I [Syntrophomonadaceae bacterium]|nr:DNA polymerase I [Syntrophomonadaceae bacterium]
MSHKLVLVDGNSLLYRAFYALPLLHTSNGIYTNAVYGFLTMFNRVMQQEQPSHVAVAFDKDKQTFRTDMYADYKANRTAAPDELGGQFALIREVLSALNIPYVEIPGYEGDDIIGTLSLLAQEAEMDTLIVTGDNDALQLVSERVKVLVNKKGITETELYDQARVLEKWGVIPAQMIEIKALMGDSSDNIPGVPGVGAKTAAKLIKEYRTLENLYEHLTEIGGKLHERLAQNQDQAFLSRKLATIARNLDAGLKLEELTVKEPHREEIIDLYRRLEFNNLLNNIEAAPVEPQVDEHEIDLIYIDTPEDMQTLCRLAASVDSIAFYIKTDYYHPMWANIEEFYIEADGRMYCLQIKDGLQKLEWVRPLAEDPSIKKIVHNCNFASVLLHRQGIELNGILGDTMLLGYVNDPSVQADDLRTALFNFLNRNIPKENAALQAAGLRELYAALKKTTDEDLFKLYQEVELPLAGILAAMEETGVKIDLATLQALSLDMGERIQGIEENIYRSAGKTFNINSPKQLAQVLFEDLGLKPVKKTKTGYATGVEVLEKLYDEHEIIPAILDYRQLAKLKSTYADALQSLIHPETGRVHTIFKQATTATGRLSSVEPNLQNIPIKMEEGRRIRKAFTAGDKDWTLLSADYSQIDLRSLAHISGDEELIETFRQNIDIHTRTAAQIFKVPLDQVTSDLRRRAKAVNFGIVYGISDFGLARDTGVSRREAGEYIERYLDNFPGVRQYMHDVVEFGKTYGYVETLLKRRRYLPDLNARNKNVQAFAQRMALNTPIQGTSADIIKLAMLKVYESLQQRGLKARLLLQVHDELVLEVPRSELEETALLVRECMEHACVLKVPLEVSLEAGDNWYDMQELEVSE